ncbi:MAG: ABC transporter substrate-binding protein [Anaerolineae bacterium]|nr:ABC transporter substrate-binding protein [Anaerolineae bacterium]
MKKVLSRLGLAGLVLGLALPWGAGRPTTAQQDDLTTVRVGLVPVLVYSSLFVAEARGYFAEEGLQIETLPLAGGSEPLAPLARGELDVALGGSGAGLFNYAARNLDTTGDANFRIVAGMHSERPPLSSPLVVSAERFESGEITSVEDLRGGRVAINAAGAATEYWLVKALEQGGLTPADVEIVAVAFPDVPAALNSEANDRIDAAILGEPIAAAAEAQGLIARLSTDFLEDFQPTYVYMGNEFLEENRETAQAFLRAMVRAYRDLQDPATWREPEIVAYLSEVTIGYSEELLDFYAFPFHEPDGTVRLQDMEILQQYFLDKGDLTYDEALDLDLLVDTSLLDEVIEELGPYEAETDN